jgi:hypothetical protein
MIFNKWKKRAYAERELNGFLEEDLINCKNQIENLYKIFKIMEDNPVCRQIIQLKLEAEMSNKEPTKLYLSPEKQSDLYNSVGKHLSYAFQGEGSMTMIYGLQVYTTQYNMRVE